MANNNMNFSVDLLPSTNNTYNLGTNDKKWKIYGNLNTNRITLPPISGTGTTGADQGSSNTSTRYKPAVWTFNTGITPVDGDIITVKQPCAGHDYGTWVTTDNGSTYHPIVYSASSRLTTHFSNNTTLTLCYDANGTASVFARGGAMSRTTATGVWRVLTMYDSNSNDTGYYHRRIYSNLKAGGAIHPYSIIMQLPNGRWSGITTTAPTNPTSGTISPVETGKNASTSGYMLGHVLLMYGRATYADGNNIETYHIWSAHTGLIDARYSFNLENSSGKGFTAYAPVYIVGSLNNSGLFVLDSTKWWTQTLPSSDDGKIYIYIGDAYDWYRLTFTEDKPIYWYKDGKVQLYSGASNYSLKSATAGSVALSGVTGADDLKAIEALSGTSGFLKKTAANTWTLDTNTYLTSSTGVTSVAGKTGAVTLAKGDVGLGNVANSTYAGGTAVTLNNSSKASSTASFYAPTAGGTADTQALVGNGATAAPKWVDISPSITIGAGTGSAAPTVNVTVLGRSGTAKSITTASTSVYGVTKLNDGIGSNSTTLAATANSALVAAKKVASSNSTSKLYLVGATSQSTTGVDSYSYQYTYTNNGLLSTLKVGLNLNGTEKAHLEWNNTNQSIDFIFE